MHVYVKPFAHNYSATAVVATGTATIPVKTISGDTPTQITVLSTPSKGSVSVSGTSFRYTPVLAGTYSFTYTYTDSEGMVSLPGTVTMTVSTFVAPAVTDLAYPKTAGTFLAAASGTEFTLDLRADTNNAAGYKTSVQTLPGGGVLKAGGTTIGAATPASPFITTQPLKWTAPNNSAGTWRFNYKIVSPDDERSSDTKMVTVTVMPVANPQTISVARNTTKNPKPQLTRDPDQRPDVHQGVQPELRDGGHHHHRRGDGQGRVDEEDLHLHLQRQDDGDAGAHLGERDRHDHGDLT